MQLSTLPRLVTSALAVTAVLPDAPAASSKHRAISNPSSADDTSPRLRGTASQERALRATWSAEKTTRQLGSSSSSSSSSNGCRARIQEIKNHAAVYTVSDASIDVCPKWIGEAVAKCPGVETLLPSENFVNSFKVPNDVLAYSLNPVLRGWVSAVGDTTNATEKCVASTFNHVIGEFKSDPLYKIELGLGIGIPLALLAGGGVYLAAVAAGNRRSAVTAQAA
jgi:hypothetical protein